MGTNFVREAGITREVELRGKLRSGEAKRYLCAGFS